VTGNAGSDLVCRALRGHRHRLPRRHRRLDFSHEDGEFATTAPPHQGNETSLKINWQHEEHTHILYDDPGPSTHSFPRRTMTTSLSSMITLPSSSANGFYSSWRAYPEIASPTTSDDSFSPPGSPPNSPSLMTTLPGGLGNCFYSSWNHYADIVSPAGSGSLSPSMSRSSSPPYTINQVLSQRASWPVSRPFSERPTEQQNEQQNSEDNSRPTSMTTSVSFSYTVRSINSRKSRMMVLYPRPVRPKRASCVEVIAESESAGLSTESLVPLSSRPVSLSNPPQGNRKSIMDKQVSCG